ncbi:SRPBCC family protein [Sphingobacterium rhinopitheci]|uniref:SRPBCC family protein n=1 Tax=Sphingobacterium rhinopitheci TaxID=2781960 RepID=UPI001F525FDB|nr:SRPBCC family protein [Sphingobacterium rhinopitheci]MCI0919784.1 SRPBCC family protein [Sphingobacterium rhinopitheci]
MKYQLYREQQLNCSIETAWDFFSSPKNLSTITPKDMGFTVISDYDNVTIYDGMVIDYIVSPLFKIPLKWKTIIRKVDFQVSFTDFQAKGPYKFWNHLHEFIPNEHGVLMKDTIDYELPFGVIGDLAHKLMIKNKLVHIFDYRRAVLDKKFNH